MVSANARLVLAVGVFAACFACSKETHRDREERPHRPRDSGEDATLDSGPQADAEAHPSARDGAAALDAAQSDAEPPDATHSLAPDAAPDTGPAADSGVGGDMDRDGFAVPADCDDGDPSVRPGADEVFYDGVDQDCSGSDEDDLDRDGFPGGAGGSDCDDLSAAVRPGSHEICGDRIDNDCDGSHNHCALAGTIPLAWADAKLIGDDAERMYGDSVAGVGDLNGDGYDDVAVNARDPYGPELTSIYVVYGPLDGAIDLAHADAIIGTSLGAGGAVQIRGVGDTNADGFDDFIANVPWPDGSGGFDGAATLVRGPVFGSLDITEAGILIPQPDDAEWTFDVNGAGDVNGDGFQDVLLSTRPAVYLMLGGKVAPQSAEALVELRSGVEDESFGFVVDGLGDANADGFDDFIVLSGSNGMPDTIFIYYGDAEEVQRRASLEVADANCGFPWEAAGVGDLNRDGRGDLALICPASGRLYVFTDLAPGSTRSTTDADATVVFSSTNAWGAIAPAGDINGDGYADIIAARPLQAGGTTYLLYGPLHGEHDESALAAIFLAEDAGDQAGCDVDRAGDTNGDGFDDLIIGARYANFAGPQVGGAYLILGRGR